MSAQILGDEPEGELVAEINITPLVDVVLVLLVIFMITAPMLTMSLKVDLPEVSSATPAAKSTVVVTVGEEGTISIDGQIVSLEQAVEKVKERRADEQGAVFLRGDRGVPYGFVLSVLDGFLQAGINDVDLLVEPLPAPADADSPAPRRTRTKPAR